MHDAMKRETAMLGGLIALMVAIASFAFALWATGTGSVVTGLGKGAVLLVAAAGIAVACFGLNVASRGFPERSWPLHLVAVLLAITSYALALGIAENS